MKLRNFMKCVPETQFVVVNMVGYDNPELSHGLMVNLYRELSKYRECAVTSITTDTKSNLVVWIK